MVLKTAQGTLNQGRFAVLRLARFRLNCYWRIRHFLAEEPQSGEDNYWDATKVNCMVSEPVSATLLNTCCAVFVIVML